jgi:predicted ATPase
MLTSVSLNYFKCFERLHLPLASLTLLSGLNAAGKSSTLQAFSLLHQSAVESEWTRTLILNGRLVALGSASDVIDKITGRHEFSISLESDTFRCSWHMRSEDRVSDLAVPISRITWSAAEDWQEVVFHLDADQHQRIYHLLPEDLANRSEHAQALIRTLIRIAYISAERIGPRETYPATTPDQQTNVGPRGEYAPWFLYYFGDRRPLDRLLIKDAPPTLQRQSEAWIDRFFPGSGLVVRPVEGANLMTMGIRTSTATSYHRPQNVGFGITHVLPIVTSCLGAESGDVILIENPESHLHPAGQSAMGRFLAMAAAAGAQVILETHSDHVLNGVRRAVKDGAIAHEQVAIHFFTARTDDDSRAQVYSPLIDPSGNIDTWPEGFFDQFDKDTAALIDW